MKSSDRRRAAASSAAGAASRSPPARPPARGGQQVAGLVGVVLVGALTRRHPGRVVGGQPGERVGVAGEDLLDEPGPVDGQVEGLAGPQVVEGGALGVAVDDGGQDPHRVDLDQLGVLGGLDPPGVGGETSETMSTSPSPLQASSRASAGDRSLRNTTRSRRGPRSVFQWSRLASRTTRSVRGLALSSQMQVNGSAWMRAASSPVTSSPQ